MKREYISTRNMSREEWLEKRRGGVGGSDCAAVMGESAWGSPLTVYMDKRALLPDREMTEPMRQGAAFEDAVARRFMEATGLKVRRCMRMYRHPEHPFMIANIDRRVVGAEGFEGLECKTTSVFNRADFLGGEIPPEYYWQCMHYMAVTGAKRWHLAVMVLSKAFHRFVIPRDEAAIARLVRREKDFWENNVLAGVPPRPSGLDADDEAIRSVLTLEADDGGGPAIAGRGAAVIGSGTAIVGSGTAADLSDLAGELDELARNKAEKAALDRRIRAAEQLVRLRMGTLEEALAGSWRITNREQAHAALDTVRLRADCPELCARYMKSSPRRVLKITDMTLR